LEVQRKRQRREGVEIMAITLPDARQLSDEILQALRMRALRACELGFTEADVADLLGVSRETVSRWWSAYAARGLDGLPQERSGRPLGGVSARVVFEDSSGGGLLLDAIDENHPLDDLGQQR
jgi:hypothetical protein